jgi:hypothetical protein
LKLGRCRDTARFNFCRARRRCTTYVTSLAVPYVASANAYTCRMSTLVAVSALLLSRLMGAHAGSFGVECYKNEQCDLPDGVDSTCNEAVCLDNWCGTRVLYTACSLGEEFSKCTVQCDRPTGSPYGVCTAGVSCYGQYAEHTNPPHRKQQSQGWCLVLQFRALLSQSAPWTRNAASQRA